jgi:hypothetical protein
MNGRAAISAMSTITLAAQSSPVRALLWRQGLVLSNNQSESWSHLSALHRRATPDHGRRDIALSLAAAVAGHTGSETGSEMDIR